MATEHNSSAELGDLALLPCLGYGLACAALQVCQMSTGKMALPVLNFIPPPLNRLLNKQILADLLRQQLLPLLPYPYFKRLIVSETFQNGDLRAEHELHTV